MFDIFGIEKANAMEAIQELMCGATRGLIEAFEFRLEEKQREIDRLKEHVTEEKTYKERYKELLQLIELKEKKEKVKPL